MTPTCSSVPERRVPSRSRRGAVLLRGFAAAEAASCSPACTRWSAQAPFRHMVTPGGLRMSVAMTNCGALGWVSDRTGYRYDAIDPDSGRPGRRCRASFRDAGARAAAQRPASKASRRMPA